MSNTCIANMLRPCQGLNSAANVWTRTFKVQRIDSSPCKPITYFWKRGSSILGPYKEGDDSLPRITCPQKMLQKLEKREKRRQEKFHGKKDRRPKQKLLISCSRKEYNFYAGQRFQESDVTSLASCGWKNTRRIGDHFTLLAHSENPSLLMGEDDVLFEDLGLGDELCSGLAHMEFQNPTEIQKLSIPPLLDGENVIIAAETGCGKTLAYLLPCFELIQRKKKAMMQEDLNLTNSPFAVVISPNRELTRQIMGVAETLAPFTDCTPHLSFSGKPVENGTPMDILVTTVGQLNILLSRRLISGKQLRHLVIDESDTLLDDSFMKDVQAAFRKLKIVPAEEMSEDDSSDFIGTQIALVSATMPRDMQESLGSFMGIDSFTTIRTDALHRLPPHVNQKFIRINPDSKPEALVQLLHKSLEKKQSCLVFVKDAKTCFYVSSMLGEMGMHCLSLSGSSSQEDREKIFQSFVDGVVDVLVATDIASRGLDTVNVGHVINYDFPQHMSDYIHRVGRVGRVGSHHPGQVTSYVSHKWDVDLLWKIEIAARRGKFLGDVNANIKRKLEGLKQHKDKFELKVVR